MTTGHVKPIIEKKTKGLSTLDCQLAASVSNARQARLWILQN